MILGHNIKMIRKKWGMYQDEFGKLFEVSGPVVGHYETGTTTPKLPFLIELERLSGIPIYSMYTREISDNEITVGPIQSSVHEPKVILEKGKAVLQVKDLYHYPSLIEYVEEIGRRLKKLEDSED